MNAFKHLLPRSKIWRITTDKLLRRFFAGLSVSGDDARDFIDQSYLSLDPQRTTNIDQWETQFALPKIELTEQERRDRLDASWKFYGGQSPAQLQTALQLSGFQVWLHEWWHPIAEYPAGGSVNGDVTPVARDPQVYLTSGGANAFYIGAGHDSAFAGGDIAFASSGSVQSGYALVNKILENGSAKQYTIPSDTTKHPYFIYIGGQIFPEVVTLPQNRRDEFEDLCLKLFPAEQWLGILVNYS